MRNPSLFTKSDQQKRRGETHSNRHRYGTVKIGGSLVEDIFSFD